jgi:hypothetical protein
MQKFLVDAPDRRAIHVDAILRGPQDDRLVARSDEARGQFQTGASIDALDGLEAIYPKPRLSLSAPGHQVYP